MTGQPEDEIKPSSDATPTVDNSQKPDNTDWKKRYDDSSQEARKLYEEKTRKESLLLNIAVDKVVSDPDYLESLATTDKELAESVAKAMT
jgi:hypothetical protein